MSTFQTAQHVQVYQTGSLYNCTGTFGTFLATDADELIQGLSGIQEANISDLFGDGAATSWTFVKSEFAGYYDLARSMPKTPVTMGIGTHSHVLSTHLAMLHPGVPKETTDAIEWMDENAKSRVGAWTYPGTQSHFYIFEDPQEAVLFKLSVTV